MLKKSGALLLTLLYTLTVYGFALNLHYCGKLLTGVTIETRAKGCGMLAASKMKCCKDKQIQIKVKDAHQSASAPFTAKSVVLDLPQPLFDKFIGASLTQISVTLSNKAPPGIPPDTVPVFIRNQSFRI